jgi:hypothetical protein
MDKETQALIDAAVTKTREEMKAIFEEATVGLRNNRDTILAEKRALEGKGPAGSRIDALLAEIHTRADAMLDANKGPQPGDKFIESQKPNQPNLSNRDPDGTFVIPANSTAEEYQRIRQEAVDAGAKFRMPQRQVEPVDGDADNIKVHDFELHGSRYVSKKMVEDYGGPTTARAKLGEFTVFKSLQNLHSAVLDEHNRLAEEQKDD